ncbi:hypothetical protein GCM10008909_17370 [Hathewaya limosa]
MNPPNITNKSGKDIIINARNCIPEFSYQETEGLCDMYIHKENITVKNMIIFNIT